ncbi:MAG TPA: leucine-rich repeat domain-containing protein, partial [Prolixibacteraceae bacterium]|nr:leucine-rich repeat domain-containing protein [Prolixibacteraceae bacterium]
MTHLLTFLMLLCMSMVTAANALTVKVPTAGTLKAEVEKQVVDYLTVTELTISGPLNGADILTLRKMTGRGYYATNKTNGQLSVLDLTNAFIVEGGDIYTGNNTTKNNLFPQDAFSNCPKLTSIVLPNSIHSIEPYAFYYCEALTSVTIPNSVTTIGKYAFCGCRSLVTFTIPNSVISMGKNAFS